MISSSTAIQFPLIWFKYPGQLHKIINDLYGSHQQVELNVHKMDQLREFISLTFDKVIVLNYQDKIKGKICIKNQVLSSNLCLKYLKLGDFIDKINLDLYINQSDLTNSINQIRNEIRYHQKNCQICHTRSKNLDKLIQIISTIEPVYILRNYELNVYLTNQYLNNQSKKYTVVSESNIIIFVENILKEINYILIGGQTTIFSYELYNDLDLIEDLLTSINMFISKIKNKEKQLEMRKKCMELDKTYSQIIQ